jgi:hypothetical protein
MFNFFFFFDFLFMDQSPSFFDVQPVIGTSILNLALLIQKNNLNASNNSIVQSQWKSQTRSPQINFPASSRRSPPDNQQRNVTDRRSAWRSGDNRPGRVQKNADKDLTSNRSDKNTLVKKQETAQKVSHADKCPKDQSVKRNEEIKGLYIVVIHCKKMTNCSRSHRVGNFFCRLDNMTILDRSTISRHLPIAQPNCVICLH